MAKKGAEASTVTAGDTRGGIVKMRFKTKKQAEETRGVSCLGGSYKRENDGTYLVKREHVPALMGLGLEAV